MPSSPFRAAVLDLGSNTFKLLLAEQVGSTLRLHHEKAYPVRLGEGVALTGKIQPTSCLRALRVLTRLQRKIRIFHPSKIIAVATGTLRRAHNRQTFLSPATRILGQKITLLTGHTEGRLIALAARQLSPRRSPRFHLDLGGGSLEVIDSLHPARPTIVSLNLGCVAIRDSLLPHHPPTAKTWLHATAQIQKSLKKLRRPLRPSSASFSGGTGHAYACLLQSKNIKARRLEGFRLKLTKLDSLIDQIRPLTLSRLRRLPGMPSDRASVALAAFLVLRETMARLQLTSVQLTTHGLRYGVWLDQIAPSPLKKIIR